MHDKQTQSRFLAVSGLCSTSKLNTFDLCLSLVLRMRCERLAAFSTQPPCRDNNHAHKEANSAGLGPHLHMNKWP